MTENRDLDITHGFEIVHGTPPQEAPEAEPPDRKPEGPLAGDAPASIQPDSPGEGLFDDAGNESSASETPVVDAELQTIVEFIRALSKSVKSARMYPTNNPVYLRSLTELIEKLGRAFQEHNLVRLVVGQTRLYFQGETVYESNDPEDSLARLLFRDGIREISFHMGLDRDEAARFLDMVRETLSREATDDLVTQMWGDTLPHITYTAIDDMLDADLAETEVPAEFGSDFMNYVDFEIEFMETEEESGDPSRDEALAKAGEMHRKLMETGDREIIAVSGEEDEELRPEVREEDASGLVLRVLDTFFDVVDQDPDPGSRNEFLVVIENALTSLVERQHYEAACHVLDSLGELVERRPDLVKAHQGLIEGVFKAAADPSRLEKVIDVLEQTGHESLGHAENYLTYVGPDAVPTLCELLGIVESRRARQALCRALARQGQTALEHVIPYLQDERWFLVRNILVVLGEMKSASTVKHIKPLVSHADIRVRREALTALSLIGQGEAIEALHALLRDPDPRMRVSAASSLSRMGRAAVNPILQIILAKEFDTRSFEEKRGVFEALGRTNVTDVLPYLSSLLNKKPMFKKQQAEQMRVCAVEALSRMRGAESDEMLSRAAKDPSALVRAAVSGAHKRRREEMSSDE